MRCWREIVAYYESKRLEFGRSTGDRLHKILDTLLLSKTIPAFTMYADIYLSSKMRKIVTILAIAPMLLASCSSAGSTMDSSKTLESLSSSLASPYQEDEQGLAFHLLDDGTYGVSAGTANYLSEIVIPPSQKGIRVTQIIDGGFKDCSNLRRVTIPDTVRSIGKSPFNGCPIEDTFITVTKIEEFLRVEGKENLLSLITLIDDSGSSITHIDIPDSITSIPRYAFSSCHLITSITLLGQVHSIGDYAFAGCDLKTLAIPDSVTEIGDYCFSGNSSLTQIAFGTNLERLGRSAFSYCTSLKKVVLPNKLTEIQQEMFYGCSALKAITLGESIKTVGENAFGYCEELETVNIDDAIEYLGHSSFGEGLGVKPKLIYNQLDGSKYLGNKEHPYLVLVEANPEPNEVFFIHQDCRIIYGSPFQNADYMYDLYIPNPMKQIGQFELNRYPMRVFFHGNQEEWGSINKGDFNRIAHADIYYYSESEPSPSNRSSYWRFLDGIPTPW